MKKWLYIAAAFLFLGTAFFMGYWSGTAGSPVTSPLPSVADGKQGTAASDDAPSSVPGAVRVNPEKQQLMGIKLATLQKMPEKHTLRVLGRVAADERRVYIINAAVDGWIRETFDNATGSQVKKDEPLVSYYSPEFLSAQQAYIYYLGSLDRFKESEGEVSGQVPLTKTSMQQYVDNLRNLGMGEAQIQEIASTRKISLNIQMRAPTTGFVIDRNVSPGQRFTKGSELYKIADLRRVWILADLFENEARYFKPGKPVKVSLPQQEKTFTATVSSVLPRFDPATRTLKVRLEADNPGYILRPDMFVDVELPVTFAPALTVPAGAILEAGLRKTVFVDRGNGTFEPRLVETGWRFGNRVEITRGLAAGERIVTAGNFLIDSESKMELAASGTFSALEKDPVCGENVSARKAEKTGRASVYRGKAYYFSSLDCKRQFDANPANYLEKPAK
ncbi:MAG: efflux RND transporter periplasmic adaptor subunit [Deltaproteobacteria bacterium]|nr:efflux RND transporter periplasmic adaptor subunit [Deltaproteobacteria bacterium]